MRKKKRHVAFLLAILMIMTVFPVSSGTAYAANSNWSNYAASSYAGGDGTQNNPYLISSPEQLTKLAVDINTRVTYIPTTYYKLSDNIDLSGHTWTSIGRNHDFMDVFDGNGYTISNMTIYDDNSNTSFATGNASGLFGFVAGGSIKNVVLKNISITTTYDNSSYVGGLVGYLNGSIAMPGVVENCYVSGSIYQNAATLSQQPCIGGACGNIAQGVINNTVSSVTITKTAVANTDLIAAFAGYASYAQGTNNFFDTNLSLLSTIGSTSSNTSITVTGNTTTDLHSQDTINLLNNWRSTAARKYTYNQWKLSDDNHLTLGTISPYELTSFAPIEFDGGVVGSTTYLTAADVSSNLPNSVYAYCNVNNYNIGPVAIPVANWVPSNGYDPNAIGLYTFTAVLGPIPDGYLNPDNITAYADVVVHPDYWDSHITSVSEGVDYSYDGNSTYHIYTKEGMAWIGNLINQNPNSAFSNKTIQLDNNIDMADYYWYPITSFRGVFNGNGHIIKNLKICDLNEYVGFFRAIRAGGSISDLRLENVDVTGYNNYTGALAGVNSGSIHNCYITGQVTGTDYVGGLTAANQAEILYSSSNATVNGSSLIAGFVALNYQTIANSYATGNVGNNASTFVAGFVCANSGGNITNCYSTGQIKGASNLDGFANINNSTMTNCYYDTTTSEQTDNLTGTGLATTLMKATGSYYTWDFTSIWGIANNINNGYPYLQALAGNNALSDLKVAGSTISGFSSNTRDYNITLPYNTQLGSSAMSVTATAADPEASVLITPASTLPGDVIITVTAKNMPVTKTYTIHFSLASPPNNSSGDTGAQDNVGTGGNNPGPGGSTANHSNTLLELVVENPQDWKGIEDKLSQLSTGAVTIDLQGSTQLPKELLTAVQGHDITVTLKLSEDIQWMINGMDFLRTGPTGSNPRLQDIDFNVALNTQAVPEALLRNLVNQNSHAVQLSLAHNGSFGGIVTLRMRPAQRRNGNHASLFYYNPKLNRLELQSIGLMDQYGYAEFKFVHASDYVILTDNGDTLKNEMNQITAAPSKKTLYIGGTTDKTTSLTVTYPQVLTDSIANGNFTSNVTYTSSNSAVATVTKKGIVKALKEGKTTITTTVTLDGVTKSFQTIITVKKASIKLIKSVDTLKKGAKYNFKAVGYGINTSDLTWSTTKPSIIVIHKTTGFATVKSTGTDYVIARVGRLAVKQRIVVTE